MSVPAFPQSSGCSDGSASPRRPTPRTTQRVDVVLDDFDAERAHGRDRRLRVGRAAEAGDADVALAERADEHRSVRDRLVARHRDVPLERGHGLDAHRASRRWLPDARGPAPPCRSRENPGMRIFSGIRAVGRQDARQLQRRLPPVRGHAGAGRRRFCIVDLHSITTAYEPEGLHEATLAGAAMLFATGIDPERSIVFAQSHVTAHAEAAWLLSSATSFGELRRMTQFKDKSADQEFVSAGLFTYPVLMAGDILLYQTDIVPIGDDQRQHLELTRDVAERFNSRYGETFTVPQGVYPGGRRAGQEPPGARAADVDVRREPAGRRPDRRRAGRRSGRSSRRRSPTRSARSATTSQAKPGISNLIEIMSVATGEPIDAIEARYDGAGYGQFKEDVGEAVVALLAPIQERYRALRADEPSCAASSRQGAEQRARSVSARRSRRCTSAWASSAPPERQRLEPDLVAERRHLVGGQLAPLARREPDRAEPRIAPAVEVPNGVPDRLAHALHLVLAALVQRELEPADARPATDEPHVGRRRTAVLELDAARAAPRARPVVGEPSTSAS